MQSDGLSPRGVHAEAARTRTATRVRSPAPASVQHGWTGPRAPAALLSEKLPPPGRVHSLRWRRDGAGAQEPLVPGDGRSRGWGSRDPRADPPRDMGEAAVSPKGARAPGPDSGLRGPGAQGESPETPQQQGRCFSVSRKTASTGRAAARTPDPRVPSLCRCGPHSWGRGVSHVSSAPPRPQHLFPGRAAAPLRGPHIPPPQRASYCVR